MTLNRYFALNSVFTPVSHRGGTGSPGHGSPGHRVSDFGRIVSGHGSVCQSRCLTQFWAITCAFIAALFLRSNTISAVSVSVLFGFRHSTTGLFISVSARNIFTYLRADCSCDVTTFLDLTSGYWPSRVGSPVQKPSGRVGSWVKNPDPVPSLVWQAPTVRLSKNNCVKSNKDRHILSAGQIFGRDSIVSGNIRFVRIFARVV